MGRPVCGYKGQRIVCTQQCAAALQRVHERVQQDGYRLVVYDAFRPQRAVDDFARWSEDLTDQCQKGSYFPFVEKSRVFELGYVALKSGHSRGSTVDVTLIRTEVPLKKEVTRTERVFVDGRTLPFLDDNTVDMGTSFDLFDEASHHDSSLVVKEHLANRNYLRQVMQECGFRALQDEWWHYTLENEPFPETYFDFDIC
jgi:D-alanyl-D-alanine dipeptidase